MRPRTATIQVYRSDSGKRWVVDIGNPGASEPSVSIMDESLEDALILAVVEWKEKEGLDDS